MNPKVAEAALAPSDKLPHTREDVGADCARRVLNAQAECVSDGAVDFALRAFCNQNVGNWSSPSVQAMRAGIAAALRFEAGE
jgi:hypothetical protein